MSSSLSLIAATRFGLGPKPGEIAAAASDPRGHVLNMIEQPDAALIRNPLPQEAGMEAAICADEKKEAKAREAKEGKDGASSPPGMRRSPAQCFQLGYAEEVAARVAHASATDAPFVERLVQFWSNHFAVSAAKVNRKLLVGDYERRAIRPHVLGSFRDMLGAVSAHPAMLMYLNNHQSVGPKSKAGRRKKRGLNENFARELLELHTLGADGGYTQTDVTNLARILTGWTVTSRFDREPYAFTFSAKQHEPGAWEVLGRSFDAGGVAQGKAVLDMLASHPSTARHVARKISRHFISENPPESLVERLTDVFLETEGDLAELAWTLVESDEAWTSPPVKVLPPYDFMVSSLRVTGVRLDGDAVIRAMKQLGQPVWMPPSPEGWPDDDDAWLLPDALLERLDWVANVAKTAPGVSEVEALARSVFGEAIQPAMSQAIARAESQEQALALLLMSPQLQRR